MKKILTIAQATQLTNEELAQLTSAEKKAIKKDRTTLPGYRNGMITNPEHKRIIDAINGSKVNSKKKVEEATAETPQPKQKVKKYRYVMTDIEKRITSLSFLAKGIYNNLLVTHDSNSLGCFTYDLDAKAGYLKITVDELIKGLEELQNNALARYINGYIYINDFIQDQKSNGGDDNKRGAVKIYNELPNNVKLPYIGALDLATASTKEVNDFYHKLADAIKVAGDFYSAKELDEIFENKMTSIWPADKVESIITNGYVSHQQTIKVKDIRKNLPTTTIIYEKPDTEYLGEFEEVDQQFEQSQQSQIVDENVINTNNEVVTRKKYSKNDIIYLVSDTTNIPAEELLTTDNGKALVDALYNQLNNATEAEEAQIIAKLQPKQPEIQENEYEEI